MNTNQKTVSSIVLSVIMVMSVIAVAAVPVAAQPTLDVTTTDETVDADANEVTVTYEITNNGDEDAFGVNANIADRPSNYTFVEEQSSGAAFSEDEESWVWTTDSLSPGDSFEVSITYELNGEEGDVTLDAANDDQSVTGSATSSVTISEDEPPEATGEASVDFERQTLDIGGDTVTVSSTEGATDPYTVAIWNVTAAGNPDEIIATEGVDSGTQANLQVSGVDIDETQDLAAAVHNGTGDNVDLDPAAIDVAEVRVPDADVTDGAIRWQGQGLVLGDTSGLNTDNLQLRSGSPESSSEGDGGSFETDLTVRQNGNVFISTENLDAQRYFVTDDGGATAAVRFEIAIQDLDAEWDTERVSNTGEQTEAELTLESNRDNYDVTVSAEGLDADDLVDIFGDSQIDSVDEEDDEVTFTGLGTDETFDAEFEEIDSDDYEFNIEVDDTTASDTAEIEVREIDPDLQFSQSSYSEAAGDISTIELDIGDTDEAYVFIGTSDVNYVERVYLTDENDNGSVSFDFNTRYAGFAEDDQDRPAFEANDGTELEVQKLDQDDYDDLEVNATLDRQIEDGSYEMVAASSGDYDVNDNQQLLIDDEQDVSVLELTSPDVGDINIHTAPTDRADADDLDELLEAVTKGEDDPTDVALDDRVILELEVSGIFGEVEDVDTLAASPLSIDVEQEEDTVDTNRDPLAFNISGAADSEDAITVFFSQEDERIFAVMDTSRIEPDVLVDGLNVGELRAGQTYNASATVEDNPERILSGETAEGKEFNLIDREAELDNSPYNVTNTENETISGTSTVAPGTELTLRVRSEGNWVFNEDVEVQDDGTFAGEFDFSEDAEIGDEYTVSVRRGNLADQVSVDGTVVEAVGEPANLEVSDLNPTDVAVEQGDVIEVSATIENTGEESGVQDVTFQVDGNELASEEVELDGGEDTTVTFSGIDTSDLEPGDYEHGVFTDDDSQTATLTVEEPEPEDDSSEDDSTEDDSSEDDSTEDDSSEDDSTEDDSETDDEGGVPGFGVIVALIALIGAAMLAARRQN